MINAEEWRATHAEVQADLRHPESWLRHLASFDPEVYVLAYHTCPVVMGELCRQNYRLVYSVYSPGWLLQPVLDEGTRSCEDTCLEDIFGTDVMGFLIDYCPGCGELLPDLGTAHVLDPWQGGPAITMKLVAAQMGK